jgi:hypothetical protein
MIKRWNQYNESFKKLSSTDDEIREYAKKLLNDKIEDIFIDIHQEFNTESGDISPDQQLNLDNILEDLSKLIAKQVHQNLGKDFKKIKSNEIDIETLKSLDDEKNSIKEGDDVIAVYYDGGFEVFRFKVSKIYKFPILIGNYSNRDYYNYRNNSYLGLGYREDLNIARKSGRLGSPITYLIEDAYLVVTVDTYNDFVKPEERLD